MDRLNLEPTRRLDRAGKEAAGLAQCSIRDLALVAQKAQFLLEMAIGQHCPSAEAAKEAVLHLARGGLGIGEAQDVLRIDPVKQEPGHPVGQNARLARACIGREPCRKVGACGLDLGLGGGVTGGHWPTLVTWGGLVRSHSP